MVKLLQPSAFNMSRSKLAVSPVLYMPILPEIVRTTLLAGMGSAASAATDSGGMVAPISAAASERLVKFTKFSSE